MNAGYYSYTGIVGNSFIITAACLYINSWAAFFYFNLRSHRKCFDLKFADQACNIKMWDQGEISIIHCIIILKLKEKYASESWKNFRMTYMSGSTIHYD